MSTTRTTITDPAATGWAIHDPVIRFRVHGSERVLRSRYLGAVSTRITLIAESGRSMELHDLLRRWLGWSMSRLGEIDRTLRGFAT